MIRYPELQESWTDQARADRLSVKQHMQKNPYVQGCSGGYPLLVSQWGFENDLVTDQCMAEEGASSGDSAEASGAPGSCGARYRVTNFRYVGGAFGRCGMHHLCEEAIREELYRRGPMVVSIEPDAHFSTYTGGILHEVKLANAAFPMNEAPPKDDVDCKDTECYSR